MKINKFFDKLKNVTPLFEDDVHIFIYTSKSSLTSYSKELATTIHYVNCWGKVTIEHIRESFRNADGHLWCLSKDRKTLLGVTFFRVKSFLQFLKENPATLNAGLSTKLVLEYTANSFQIRNVLYVSVVCCSKNQGCGQKMLKLLESQVCSEVDCQATALHATFDNYKYYASHNYFRTNDFVHIYPICVNENDYIFDKFIPNNMILIYFDSEIDVMYQTKSYLFMKPLMSQSGGRKAFSCFLTFLRKNQESHPKTPPCRK
jgi:hypothetical protein